MTPIVPVILAGGGGTRLWPLSRGYYPKQFLSIDGTQSLLQQTLTRLDPDRDDGLDIADPLVVCNEEHRFLVGEQARQTGRALDAIMLEPVGRNTAPALTCAALYQTRDGGDRLLLMMPADHLIADLENFRRAVAVGAAQASEAKLVTFGVAPSKPETGYGYIQVGEPVGATIDPQVFVLAAFKEKPDAATAEQYVSDGRHVWNAGLFLMKASVWLAAIERYRPDILAACQQAHRDGTRDGEFYRLDQTAFEGCPSDSIDYAVMERIIGDDAGRAVVVSLDAGWSDIGSWAGIWEVSPKDDRGNVVRGDVYAVDSEDSVIFSASRLVAALGCRDLVIVETADAVMVARKSSAQDVKKIVDWLHEQGRQERLIHRRVYRPWGSYENLDLGEGFQVKRITVKPGAALSLQMHHHRAEHWIVVQGTARVTRGDEVLLLAENESTFVPVGAVHRLENPGTIPLELIEVQSGAYLGEDDIVRLEDAYDRA
jgi:mannose-1-phosphate guanylyltransferase/mannose-6-phosphate isomerase